MLERCIDCDIRPRPSEAVPCFSETFDLKTTIGGHFHLTMRLCLSCGARFADRRQLRAYLATKLPAYASSAVAIAS